MADGAAGTGAPARHITTLSLFVVCFREKDRGFRGLTISI
jgi:hypothetical protein